MRAIIVTVLAVWCTGSACSQTPAQAATQVVSAARITEAVNSYVIEHSSVPKDEIFIEYRNPVLDETVPAGAVSIKPQASAGAKFSGFTAVGVTIEVDGKPCKKFLVHMTVDSKVKAFMATRWINHQELFTNENLMMVETYRSRVPLDCVTSEKAFAGKVAKMALPKGKFISYSVIDTPAVIKARDVVDIQLSTQNLKIMAKGAALMDGRPGEIIKLRLLDSKRDIYGKVVDATTVNVQMPN